jgi:hypothetical protein
VPSSVAAEQARRSPSVCQNKAGLVMQSDELFRLRKTTSKNTESSPVAVTNAEPNDEQPKTKCPEEQPSKFSSVGIGLQQPDVHDQVSILESSLVTVTEELGETEMSGEHTNTDHHNPNQVARVHHSSVATDHIIQWVDATKQSDCELLTPSESRYIRTSSGDSEPSYETEDESSCSVKSMIAQVMYILQSPSSRSDLSDVGEDGGYFTGPTIDGSESPKSGTGSASTRSRTSNTHSGSSSATSQGFDNQFNRGEDGEPPTKRSGGGHGPSVYNVLPRVGLKSQMPCPMSTSLGCLGTNSTISEMLRSLQNRHRTVVCTDCCCKLEVPLEERKPENVLKRHMSIGCERRCLSQGCHGIEQGTSRCHRRTENCPNWKAVPKEVRWSFVWTLLNPGLEPPSLDFISSIGYEHSSVLTRSRDKPREKGMELCRTVMADLDAKNERLQSLEHKLEASNQHNSQIQQRCDEKIANLENIIETLLERLRDKDIDIPSSLQKRLARECPGLLIPSPLPPHRVPIPGLTPHKSVSTASHESPTVVGHSTGILRFFDAHTEGSFRQAAHQQDDTDILSAATKNTTSQIANSSTVLSDLAYTDLLSAHMDTEVGPESYSSEWGTY